VVASASKLNLATDLDGMQANGLVAPTTNSTSGAAFIVTTEFVSPVRLLPTQNDYPQSKEE